MGILAGMVIVPATAQATDYHVVPSPAGGATCASDSPCSLASALGLAGGSGDRILMRAGLYSASGGYTVSGSHAGLVIQGTGTTGDAGVSTVVRPVASGGTTVMKVLSDGVTLQNMRLDTSSQTDSSARNVEIAGGTTDAVLDNVVVNHAPSGTASQPAVGIGVDASATVKNSVVDGNATSIGLLDVASGSQLRFENSTADASGLGTDGNIIRGVNATVFVSRSYLRQRDAARDAIQMATSGTAQALTLVMDSSTMRGGLGSIRFRVTHTFATVNARIFNSVLDSNEPYTADSVDPNGYSNLVTQTLNDTTTNVTISSSVLREKISTADGVNAACSYNDLQGDNYDPMGACNPGKGTNVFTSDPTALFADTANLSAANIFLPKPGGPLVDKGDPGPLSDEESATDRAGNPRIASAVCTQRRDIGAYEAVATPPDAVTCNPVISLPMIPFVPKGPPPTGCCVVVPSNKFTIKSAKAGEKGAIALSFAAPAVGTFSVKATYRRKGVKKAITYGTKTVRATKAGTVRTTLKPSKKALAALRRAKKLKVTMKITFAPTGGVRATKSKSVTAKR